MEVIAAMKARRSIRKFKPDPIPDSYVQEIIEAARLAPSGSNLQPTRFVVVKSDEARMRLNEGTPMNFVSKAPVVLVCCVDNQVFEHYGKRVNELKEAGAFLGTPLEDVKATDLSSQRTQDEVAMKAYLGLNAAIAIDHITLRAVDLGLATCWIMLFDQDKIKKAINLDNRYQVIALIPLGYPDQNPAPRPRLPLEDLVIKEL
ncbi:nitroreductase family protein [Desulfotomaculum defluvii]